MRDEPAAGGWDSRLEARIAELIEDAHAARRDGNWKLAHSLATAAAALAPDNDEVRRLLTGPATRRQMTLMFCDIVGSTGLADTRDPEEVTALLEAYRAVCADVVARHEGYIDDKRGDGMLVLFGYPQVHEDDARRAVLCGLEIVRELDARTSLQQNDFAEPLHVRVSVHTDLVVIGDGVAGSTANEASRIQDLADPDTVVVSDTTHALIAPWFETVPEGTHRLRGVGRPIGIFRVVRELPTRQASGVPPTAFVGREDELAAVSSAITATSEGAVPHALCLTGPPGIGKSRLAAEATQRSGRTLVECPCSRLRQTTSLHPFRGIIEDACGIDESDDEATRLDKLRAALRDVCDISVDLPFLGSALDIPLAAHDTSTEVQPEKLRGMALQAAARLIAAHATARSSVVFVDDVQWVDQGSAELVELLLATPGLAVLLAARETFAAPWDAALVEVLRVPPLSEEDSARLLRLMASREQIPVGDGDELAEFVDRADGVPLFLEELMRTAAEEELDTPPPSRAARSTHFDIPAALRDPLLARLSQPEIDLELAQYAAIIGRDVDPDLLATVLGIDDDDFERRLDTLLDSGIAEWHADMVRFRHELIREVAYETQRRAVLKARHGQVADALLGASPTPMRRALDEAAFHLERAERFAEAIERHLVIARADEVVGSYVEVVRRLSDVLALLDRLPSGPDRDRTELSVRDSRSFNAVMAGGYAAPEAAEDYTRCIELCEGGADAAESLGHLVKSWCFYMFRGELDQADLVTQTGTRIAADAGLTMPSLALGEGVIASFRGDYPAAARHLTEFTQSTWAATPGSPPPGWGMPHDPLTAAYAHLIPTLWAMGRADEAAEAAACAEGRAEQLVYPYGPFNVLYAKSLVAMTRNIDGDFGQAARIGLQMIELADRHGFALWRLAGGLQCLLTAVHAGDESQLPALVEAVGAWHVFLASDAWTPYWLTATGVAQQAVGRLEDAVRSFDQALAMGEANGCRFHSAEALRGRGLARRLLGDPRAEEDLSSALALARRQGAVVYERRAADVLALAGP